MFQLLLESSYLIKEQITKERLLATIATQVDKYKLQQRVETLERFLPICAWCKKIRHTDSDPTSQTSWVNLEKYMFEESGTKITHGLCPECATTLKKDSGL